MSKTRILVVDDEPNNQRILNYTLNKAGYETLTAGTGEAALDLLHEKSADLAILDVAMPGMDGITLLQHIRTMQKYENLPVIILTGSGDDTERIRAEEAGVQGFLTKPASSKMILETVNHLLDLDAKS
ncbi:MAG: response regulator [Anaerolineae bacterium]|nr:response regulator [Anaerolineae bacterium]